MSYLLPAAGCLLIALATVIVRTEPLNNHERAKLGGVKLWRLPFGFKLWIRNTKIRGPVSYDPWPRLWLPSRRVAILLPGDRERASKVIRQRRKHG